MRKAIAATDKQSLITSHTVGGLGRAACARVFREGAENSAKRALSPGTDFAPSGYRNYLPDCRSIGLPATGEA